MRSRWYSPASGRFQTKDSWQGDYNRPLSLNRWMYTEGNPVNYIDPSGFFITEDDIKQGRAVYSCNCGWIDFSHASPEAAYTIHTAIKVAQRLSPPKDTLYTKYRRDSMVIQFIHPVKRDIPHTNIYVENLDFKQMVDLGLTDAKQWEVTLGILRYVSGIREFVSLSAGGTSGYSEEDFASDMIGFYLAYNGLEDARKSDTSWKRLAQKCVFPENRDDARDQSLGIYEKYHGTEEKVWEWDSPRFSVHPEVAKYLCEKGLCQSKRVWPSEFQMITPDTEHWSRYISLPGDFLQYSGRENVYYSGYMLNGGQ